VVGDSCDVGADTEPVVPPTSTQPPKHCQVAHLCSRPGKALAIPSRKKCCKTAGAGEMMGWGRLQQQSGE